MAQQDLLRKVVHGLEAAGIEYMITGSIASSLQGEPRLTHDLDFVVAIAPDHVAALIEAFPAPEFYVSADAIAEAIRTDGMFNVLHTAEGDKVDFWVLTSDSFDSARFTRRYTEHVFGVSLKVSRPEDTILMKLRWSALSGGSEKQFQDALHVYEVQANDLDLDYLKRWADQLGVAHEWKRLQDVAELP
jgi:hypothetical protein